MSRKLWIIPSVVTMLGLSGPPGAAAEYPPFAVDVIAGSTIAAISDGDFVGQSYANGRLAPRQDGLRDLLTILSVSNGKIVSGTVPVSNSVTSAPEILKLTPDGKTAFVAERLGQRPDGGEKVSDLPPGRSLFAVDLTDKEAPRIADKVEIAVLPEGLSVSPNGARVAVVSNTPEASFVQIVPWSGGRFGSVSRFNLAEIGISGTAATPRGGVTATNVHWHPSGRVIAVNINTQNRVAFFEISEQDGKPSLRLWGNAVEVGPDPFVGRFTPDGRYYLTSNWGRNFAATALEGRIPDAPSSISVVRLSDPNAAGGAVRHERIGGAVTDLSAEGIAISPDGRLVATVNMRGTVLPRETGRFQREASVSLLNFDPASGAIVKVADYAFEGVLPEGGVFDVTGNYFLATVFHDHEKRGGDSGAGLEVFRVKKGAQSALERLGRIPMPHGVHHVDVAR